MQLPLWALLASLVVAFFGGAGLVSYRKRQDIYPRHEPTICNLPWFTKRRRDDGSILELLPLCPKCSVEISLTDEPHHVTYKDSDFYRVRAFCEACGHSVNPEPDVLSVAVNFRKERLESLVLKTLQQQYRDSQLAPQAFFVAHSPMTPPWRYTRILARPDS